MTIQTASPTSKSSNLSPDLPAIDRLKVQSDTGPPTQSTDDDELERFRSEWRQEVKSRKGQDAGPQVRTDTRESSTHEAKKASMDIPVSPKAPKSISPLRPTKPLPVHLPDAEADAVPGPSVATKNTAASATSTFKGPNPGAAKATASRTVRGSDKDRAVQMYAKAVESEQSGKLNEALMLYRKAFKLDDEVDRLYTRSIAKAAAIEQDLLQNDEGTLSSTPTSADIVSASAPVEEPYSFQRHIQMQPDYERTHHAPLATSSTSTSTLVPTRPSVLTSMLSSLPVHPDELVFLPAEEELPIPIAQLPSELLDPILSHLDVVSIERFASTCWRARYLTHVSNVWRHIAQGIYRPPAMIDPSMNVKELAKRHHGEWRTTLVEEERVRMDGCYISVCHYIRPGAGEQWVTITHLITYHRFLRFYPDGSCISFLTTDHPSEVVPILRPTLRAKGLHFGRWRLIRSDQASEPDDIPSEKQGKVGEKRRARIEITELLEPGVGEPKYEFEMELALRETGRGKWNKLDIIDYRSINLINEEALSLSLKHQKPFYFSKVRSYNPPF